MRVIVLGGGVIGVTSAYYLAQQGAEVTVLDRQAGPAEETSFGNAGQISPGYSTPSPRMNPRGGIAADLPPIDDYYSDPSSSPGNNVRKVYL